MIVLIYRGYIGFQPAIVTQDSHQSFTKPELGSFISKGILNIPISADELDFDDLGNADTILGAYKISSRVYYRWLLWDIKAGPSDNIVRKSNHDAEGSIPSYRRQPLLKPHSTASVLCEYAHDGDYLAALIHADAEFSQIDEFCASFGVGSGRPFVWTPLGKVVNMLESPEYATVNYLGVDMVEGPSIHVVRLNAQRELQQHKEQVVEDMNRTFPHLNLDPNAIDTAC